MKIPGVVSLYDLIESTAAELRKVRDNAPPPGQETIRLTECEIETEAVVGADADGSVKFWVIEAGAGVKYENTQKVTLKFKAVGDGIQAVQETLAASADLPRPRASRAK